MYQKIIIIKSLTTIQSYGTWFPLIFLEGRATLSKWCWFYVGPIVETFKCCWQVFSDGLRDFPWRSLGAQVKLFLGDAVNNSSFEERLVWTEEKRGKVLILKMRWYRIVRFRRILVYLLMIKWNHVLYIRTLPSLRHTVWKISTWLCLVVQDNLPLWFCELFIFRKSFCMG